MLQAGVKPDQVSYNILIDAFGRSGLSDGKVLTSLSTYLPAGANFISRQ